MKLDDDGRRHAVTLDEATAAIEQALEASGAADDGFPWVSRVTKDGQDRGERVLYLEITTDSGACESFYVSITRDVTG